MSKKGRGRSPMLKNSESNLGTGRGFKNTGSGSSGQLGPSKLRSWTYRVNEMSILQYCINLGNVVLIIEVLIVFVQFMTFLLKLKYNTICIITICNQTQVPKQTNNQILIKTRMQKKSELTPDGRVNKGRKWGGS